MSNTIMTTFHLRCITCKLTVYMLVDWFVLKSTYHCWTHINT